MGKNTKFAIQILMVSFFAMLVTVFLFTGRFEFLSSSVGSLFTTETVSAQTEYEDGVYTGEGEGNNGPIQVEVTVEEGQILDVKVLDHTETEGLADPAFEEVPAAIIEGNTTEVEVVSSATNTSQGIMDAVENALEGGPVTTISAVDGGSASYADGTYTGEAEGNNGPIQVEVSVQDGAISEVTILDHAETEGLADPSFEEVPAAIIETNSTEVEAVSGATVTSEGIKAAVNNALAEASGVAVKEEESTFDWDLWGGRIIFALIFLMLLGLLFVSDNNIAKAEAGEKEKVVTLPSSFEDGTYQGDAEGHNGLISVETQVKNGEISKIKVLDHSETEELALPVFEDLSKEMQARNTPNVDVVSGASVTSTGFIAAVTNALSQAGEVDKTIVSEEKVEEPVKEVVKRGPKTYIDGEYVGQAEGHYGPIKVDIKVENGQLKAIDVVEDEENKELAPPVFAELGNLMIEQNNAHVDIISGATVTSTGFINAVYDALADQFEDGSYVGYGEGHGGEVQVAVDVKDGNIHSIDVVEHNDNVDMAPPIFEELSATMMAQNRTDIDAVSGATGTSNGFISAVQNALEK